MLTTRTSWKNALAAVLPDIAAKAEDHDRSGCFVSENIQRLKETGLSAAAVPDELGGFGCSQSELAEMLRMLGRACGSTALAFSMHTHLAATAAWRWRRDGSAEALLQRVADERLILVSSGGSDWIDGSCALTKTDGGYLISGRKVFASGSPAGDLLVTTGVLTTEEGPLVLHFPLALGAPGVERVDTWDTLGMRGTGSFDILLSDVFVPEESVSIRRPAGRWHEAIHLVTKIAIPLIYAVYGGIAEAARDTAVEMIRRRPAAAESEIAAGEIETLLHQLRLALADMIGLSEEGEPGFDTSNRIMMGRSIAGETAIRTVEKALEAAGGAGFYRRTGLERLFRDVQAARYHPLQLSPQRRLAGRIALGLDPNGGN